MILAFAAVVLIKDTCPDAYNYLLQSDELIIEILKIFTEATLYVVASIYIFEILLNKYHKAEIRVFLLRASSVCVVNITLFLLLPSTFFGVLIRLLTVSALITFIKIYGLNYLNIKDRIKKFITIMLVTILMILFARVLFILYINSSILGEYLLFVYFQGLIVLKMDDTPLNNNPQTGTPQGGQSNNPQGSPGPSENNLVVPPQDINEEEAPQSYFNDQNNYNDRGYNNAHYNDQYYNVQDSQNTPGQGYQNNYNNQYYHNNYNYQANYNPQDNFNTQGFEGNYYPLGSFNPNYNQNYVSIYPPMGSVPHPMANYQPRYSMPYPMTNPQGGYLV